MNAENYTILGKTGVKTDFNNWNSMRNCYGTKGYTPRRNPPVKLVRSVIREFERFCKDYHIDATAYKFIEPCEIEGDWRQFDFMESESGEGARIQCHSIVSDNNGKIYQRVFDL